MIYATREPYALPFTRHVALLRGAPWRRVAVLGDSIAEGVREPHHGYRDLSWIDRIAVPHSEEMKLIDGRSREDSEVAGRQCADQELSQRHTRERCEISHAYVP